MQYYTIQRNTIQLLFIAHKNIYINKNKRQVKQASLMLDSTLFQTTFRLHDVLIDNS